MVCLRRGEEPANPHDSSTRESYDVSYSDPPLRACRFSCQTSAISAGRQRLSEGHHALPGPPDGAGLLLMDPAEVPNQLESRRRAAATTSQLFSAVEDGAPKE